jgi:hypothetical protein
MKMSKIMKKTAINEGILLEDGMDRAQLILAAKVVTDDLQDLAEKLAKMEAEGIMPLLDGIRTYFGPEFSDRLSSDSAKALRAALEAVKACKEQIGANISNMEQIVTGEGPGSDMATGAGLPPAEPEVPVEPEASADVGAMDDESDADLEDVFGSDAPVGRPAKESVEANVNMLRESENPDRVIMANLMIRMKSGTATKTAVFETAKAFGIDAEDVMAIVREQLK